MSGGAASRENTKDGAFGHLKKYWIIHKRKKRIGCGVGAADAFYFKTSPGLSVRSLPNRARRNIPTVLVRSHLEIIQYLTRTVWLFTFHHDSIAPGASLVQTKFPKTHGRSYFFWSRKKPIRNSVSFGERSNLDAALSMSFSFDCEASSSRLAEIHLMAFWTFSESGIIVDMVFPPRDINHSRMAWESWIYVLSYYNIRKKLTDFYRFNGKHGQDVYSGVGQQLKMAVVSAGRVK